MKRQLQQVFHSPKFVFGFILFMIMLLSAIIYPMVSRFGPLELVATGFYAPGTYISMTDALDTESVKFNVDTASGRIEKNLSSEDREKMKTWLVNFADIDESEIDTGDAKALIALWQANYDSSNPQKGLLSAEKKSYARLDKSIATMAQVSDKIIAEKGEDGLEETDRIADKQFVRTEDVANELRLPMGTDNFGRDVLTELTSSIAVSLRIGLIAGLIATLIGLSLGLLAGYVGGNLDNIITFVTNIFTVIPSFVILILIANSVGQDARGPEVVAVIIGLTAWPWTCRSVRSQVISLRNRDHVNLSKLSGHSLPRIVISDILPYVASYVVMALILQISSGILAEAQLSMLGLGPSTTTSTTLGLMMNWATLYQAHLNGYWWAYFPVILSIACITFSLNLMNTGLDQVFNPQLRDS